MAPDTWEVPFRRGSWSGPEARAGWEPLPDSWLPAWTPSLLCCQWLDSSAGVSDPVEKEGKERVSAFLL